MFESLNIHNNLKSNSNNFNNGMLPQNLETLSDTGVSVISNPLTFKQMCLNEKNKINTNQIECVEKLNSPKFYTNNEIQDKCSNLEDDEFFQQKNVNFLKLDNESHLIANCNNINLKRGTTRKNTSDSNVKLLADHNFYHVTNKRVLNDYQPKENLLYKEIAEIANSKNCINKADLKQIEINDFLKYGIKYKRGLNSSTNSLMSLNSSRFLIFC